MLLEEIPLRPKEDDLPDAVHDLLERSPDPGDTEIREELAGNVCRCTGYGRIIDAVQQVAVQRRSNSATGATS